MQCVAVGVTVNQNAHGPTPVVHAHWYVPWWKREAVGGRNRQVEILLTGDEASVCWYVSTKVLLC